MKIDKWIFIAVPVAIVGVIGPLLPSYFEMLYREDTDRSSIRIEIVPNAENDRSKAIFTVTNPGGKPATNITLIIESRDEFISVENRLSTTDIFLTNYDRLESNILQPVNSKFIRLFIPKLIQGSGSIVQLETVVDKLNDANYVNYDAYVVYDQGSAKVSTNNVRYEFSNQLLLGFYFALYFPIIIFFYYYFKRWRKRQYIDTLKQSIMNIRSTVKNDITGPMDSDNSFAKMKFIDNIGDNIRISDFFDKLVERRQKINVYNNTNTKFKETNQDCLKQIYPEFYSKWPKQKNNNELSMLNEDCLRLADEILRRIDRSKY